MNGKTSSPDETMDDIHVKRGLTIPAREFWYTTSKSGGPGGQHANKTNSRVTLHWVPSESEALGPRQKVRVCKALAKQINDDGIFQISSDQERSQTRNKKVVRERLAALVLASLKIEKKRKKTKPSKRAKQKRLDSKKKKSKKKKMRQKPKDWDD